MNPLLLQLLARCEALGASDIHLAFGEHPRFRVQGVLSADAAFPRMDEPTLLALARELGATNLPPDAANPAAAVDARFAERKSIDGAVSSAQGVRYRFNVFRENGHTAAAIRKLDSEFLPFEKLGIPARFGDFCDCRDGLVVVTGPTGSGKSTTLATMIDRINRSRDGHIITIEDPVEYVHASGRCLVNQRQIGRDATGFNEALVDSLRQDPDVILVGEIREIETIRTAITAAETGHLVFTTLHAGDCPGAIERLVSVFPADEQDGIRHQLAMVLRGVLAQHLLPPVVAGARRVAACELMVVTPAIANLIATGRSNQIYSAMETGGGVGMLSLDQTLCGLVADGRIAEGAALALSRNPESLHERIRALRGGRTHG